MNKTVLTIIIPLSFTLGACTSLPDGKEAWGRPGSPLFNMSTSGKQKREYLEGVCKAYGYKESNENWSECMQKEADRLGYIPTFKNRSQSTVNTKPSQVRTKVVSNATGSIDKIKLPIKMEWEGVSENLIGTISVPDLRKWQNPEVPVEVKLKTSSDTIKCNGSSIAKKGDWDKGEIASGVFALKCSNGRSMTGTYTSPTAGEGIGEGKDDTGANVIYFYGKSAL